MKKTLLMTCAAAFAAFTPQGIAEQDATPQKQGLPIMVRNWQATDSPVALVKIEPLGTLNEHTFTRVHDSPARLVIGKVVMSTTPKCKPGTLVLLECPGESEGVEHTWWLVDIRNALNLTENGSAIYVDGCDFNICQAEYLLQASDELSGVWKAMQEKIAQ